jgi:hypothetical protein
MYTVKPRIRPCEGSAERHRLRIGRRSWQDVYTLGGEVSKSSTKQASAYIYGRGAVASKHDVIFAGSWRKALRCSCDFGM